MCVHSEFSCTVGEEVISVYREEVYGGKGYMDVVCEPPQPLLQNMLGQGLEWSMVIRSLLLSTATLAVIRRFWGVELIWWTRRDVVERFDVHLLLQEGFYRADVAA